jgi:Spy/CpxP family protein refolding chaperone
MTRKNILIAAVVLALTAAVPFVYAQTRGGGHHGHGAGMGMMCGGGFGMMGGHLQHLKSELGLSDEQVAQLKQIAADTHQLNQPYRDAMRGNIHEIASVLLKDPSNVAAAQAIVDRNVENERQLKANVLQAFSKALSVLTPDQRAKLGDILASHAKRG